MQQFSLEKWLQDKSRKVVTRTGEPVEIVLTDWGDPFTILGRIGNSGDPIIWLSDGRSDMDAKLHDYDLFFADEEEELTKFEEEIYLDICTIVTACDGNVYGDKELKPIVKGIAKDLLDLARKELQPEFDKKMDKLLAETDKVVYQKGKQDALKDLPKWKKITEKEQQYLAYGFLSWDDYYLSIDELKQKLPKEE